jgi:hypothetical protein
MKFYMLFFLKSNSFHIYIHIGIYYLFLFFYYFFESLNIWRVIFVLAKERSRIYCEWQTVVNYYKNFKDFLAK